MKVAKRSLIMMMVGAPMAAYAALAHGRSSDRDPGSQESAGDKGDDGKRNRMFKVSVMYPYAEGARFDHAYYREKHMPMVKARLGDACEYYTIERGIGGRDPGERPAFVAMCAFIVGSVEDYRAAIEKHATEIRGDIANYTDITPVVQISEIVVERSAR